MRRITNSEESRNFFSFGSFFFISPSSVGRHEFSQGTPRTQIIALKSPKVLSRKVQYG